MKTIKLNYDTWDLELNASGNIAVASDPDSQAQDAASEIKLFRGELFYNTARGIPYWQQILGRLPSSTLMKAKFSAAARLVPGVVAARCFMASLDGRSVTGQVQITNSLGVAQRMRF